MSRITARLRAFFKKRAFEVEFEEELESHLAMLIEDNVRRGMSPQEARREALMRLGSRVSLKEEHRRVRGLPALDSVVQDVRYALRMIRRNRGFAAAAILSLAIGIGANTAIFSLVNTVVLQPMPYKDPHRVFAVRELTAGSRGEIIDSPLNLVSVVNPAHALTWAKECPSLDGIALIQGGGNAVQLTDGGEPVSVPAARVSHNFFALFGTTPAAGRFFVAEEQEAAGDGVVMISEPLWRSRFNADPSLIGRSILVDGQPRRVVGVVPATFRIPRGTNVRTDVFLPLVLRAGELARLTGNYNYTAFVRIKPGIDRDRALAEINVIQARFPRIINAQPGGATVELRAALTPVQDVVTGRSRLGLWTLTAAVGAVLLIVCLNLANLLLSRTASRAREMAIRSALGAGRMRQFRQVLTESLLLALMGGTLGVLSAIWIVRALVAVTTLDIPRLDEVHVNFTVVMFAFGLTLVTGFLFGAIPAWRLTQRDPQEPLRAGRHTVTEGRRGLRLRESLISVEVGVSTALLIVAALLGASFLRLLRVDKGFDADHVLTVDINLLALYTPPANREQIRQVEGRMDQFFARILADVSAIPGVTAAGLITYLPTRGETWLDPIYLEGDPEHHAVNNRYASPGYFRAMNIAVRQGRLFDDGDRGRDVAVLSEKAVRLLWPQEPNPVGRRFVGEDDKVKTLVGIVGDVRASLRTDPPATAYYPYWQRVPDSLSLVVRTAAEPEATAGVLRSALRNEDRRLAIPAIRTMERVVDGSVAQQRFQVTLMAIFAACALLTACLGVYGVVSYSVARRRNEIGIRMALGAERSRLIRFIVTQGMRPVIVGLAVGLAFALLSGRAIRGLLFQIEPTDPLTIAGVTVILVLVGMLACLIPARRAAGTDVVAALRLD